MPDVKNFLINEFQLAAMELAVVRLAVAEGRDVLDEDDPIVGLRRLLMVVADVCRKTPYDKEADQGALTKFLLGELKTILRKSWMRRDWAMCEHNTTDSCQFCGVEAKLGPQLKGYVCDHKTDCLVTRYEALKTPDESLDY